MSKRMVKFPSIEQFRNVVATINRQHNFVGLDENGEAIYDPSKPKPVIIFKGTVKLHGTNAGVTYNDQDGIYFQSRENVITPEKDNAGFAAYGETNKAALMGIIEEIKTKYGIDTSTHSISVYGEWAGTGIQKGVGISTLPKSFYIFGIKISKPNPDATEEVAPSERFVNYWVDYEGFRNHDAKIYNMKDFPTYEVEVDFNRPDLAQNKIIELTIAVEEECPVAKHFGVEKGIGEGIVFVYTDERGVQHIFKSKGELHAKSSKVKTLKVVDTAKMDNVHATAEKVTPAWRLQQALQNACDLLNGGQIERKFLGDFIRLVIADVVKEDLDIIAEAGLEPAVINKQISDIARKYFFEQEKELTGI